MVVTADGKGVPMRRPEAEEETARSPTTAGAKGEKANKKRMACVGAVYSIEPFVRKAEDIIDEVLRDKKAKERPRPQHKHVWAELTREFEDEPPVTAKEGLFCHLTDELTARNLGHDRPVICLMDGERALWDAQAVYFPEAVGVLDLFHVLERLWAVAHCFHKEGSDESKEFVEQRLRDLLQGRVGYVISGLRRRLKAEKLSGPRRKVVRSAVEYLENNKGAHAVRRVPCGGLPDRQRRGGRGVPPSGEGPDGTDRDAVDDGGGAGDAPRTGVVPQRPVGGVPGAPCGRRPGYAPAK